jgi:hypothetical protein
MRKKTDGPTDRRAVCCCLFDCTPDTRGSESLFCLHTAAGRLRGAAGIATAATVMPMEQAAKQTAVAAGRSAAGRLWSAASGFDRRGTNRLGATCVAAIAAATAMMPMEQAAEQTAVAAGRSTAGRLRSAASRFHRSGADRLRATAGATCVTTATAVAIEQAAEQSAMTMTTITTTARLRRTARRFCAAVAAAKQIERLRGVRAGDQPQAGQQGQRQHNPTLHGTYSYTKG